MIAKERKAALLAFARSAKIKFRDLNILNLAFVHRSISNELGFVGVADAADRKRNNERLEFLGDAVLGSVTATLLYKGFPDKAEGELAKIKSVVVSEEILAGIARELQIDTLLILGHGEENTGGRTRKAILADALEALFGALYLDSGYKAVFAFIERCIAPEIERVATRRYVQDYKSLLQERSQKLFKSYPSYRLLKRSGPEHDRYFWVEVNVNGQTYGPGMGRNKKGAEQEAAKAACLALEIT